MNAAEDRGSEFASELADLRGVPLADIRTESKSAIDHAVRRVLREQSAHQVPVAAFNSSI
jgi:FXSXX-COOH protein